MKKFIDEFKAFVSRGNVMDMAIGVIIGGAFGAITKSLVDNVITPLLAFVFGSPNTDALNITLRAAETDAAGEVVKDALVLGLGTFVGSIINFLVIALVLFSVIKAINKAHEIAEKAKKQEEEEAAAEEEKKPTAEELLGAILEEIKAKK
ncbi:MAG: large conductance mechanosensitive channel protein MscL [Oscillospiraceae bacterium]|nr:large conductance mechanosensitive channel protein MscL [Oscillospiraceae bacterium]